MRAECDAVVVGSGPNGLAAAITLARAGCSVLVCEANATIGGGARSAELTLPGFLHDVCSAVHPLAAGSPFFKTLPLERVGLEWIQPGIPLAHPLDDGSAACLYRDVDLTAEQLPGDSRAYRWLMKSLARNWEKLANEFLQPMLHWPRHPIALARFGIPANRWRAIAVPVSPPIGIVSARTGDFQNRLCLEWSDSMESRGMPPRRHNSSRRQHR